MRRSYAKQIAVGRTVLEESRLFYSFLSFFVSVFGCYSQFFTVSQEKETKGELVFDKKGYLENFAKHVKGPINDVLKEFTRRCSSGSSSVVCRWSRRCCARRTCRRVCSRSWR